MRRHETASGPTGAKRGRLPAILLTLVLLVVVLVYAETPTGSSTVTWLRGFLEFYTGVFALLAMTAAVVAGVVAAQSGAPARFRILAQAAHRSTALMTIGFLVAHVLLKVMEAHASVLDVLIPFAGGRQRLLYIGLGTIATDLLILVMATGVLRGRFAAERRPWVWRTIHALAYAVWPLAIVHGLLAGRTPKWWVTWSYIICAALVAVVGLSRLPRLARDRRTIRDRKGSPVPHESRAERTMAAEDVPDQEFWSSLRAEAAQWIGQRR
jgi:predicted ferric reductase